MRDLGDELEVQKGTINFDNDDKKQKLLLLYLCVSRCVAVAQRTGK
jgi:hypothetical protein